MLPIDVSVRLELLEILPDGRLGDSEGGAEIAHPSASLLLQPVQDLHPPRFGEQPVEVRIAHRRNRRESIRPASRLTALA